METLELCLLLATAVLLSSVVNQFFSKVSTPLVQIVLGLVIAAFASGHVEIALDPELFLVLFIAPLLYDEARESDLMGLWRHRHSVISCAVGLVIAITLCVGFFLNLVAPTIPLAAAFALGAALGPTDAVAVSSISKTASISSRVTSILKGEALFNDASGLVAFQFAVAAVTTGAFSLASAGASFALSFFGGIVFGLACGFSINFAIRKIREIGYEDTTFNVLFEVLTPFIVFLLSESLHVSGVIAVVVCGMVNVTSRRTNGPSLSRTSIVSTSVWKVLTFVLNGIVFVLLGTQLPETFLKMSNDYGIDPAMLIGLVFAATAILVVVRLAWSFLMIALEKTKGERRLTREDVREALVLTLSGAKGAITLAIMFTLPFGFADAATGEMVSFPARDALTFIAGGVIVLTLLIATFVVPLLAPKPKVRKSEEETRERNVEAALDVLRLVIEELTERSGPGEYRSTQAVVAAYSNRIEHMKSANGIEESDDLVKLRLSALSWARDYVREAHENGKVDDNVCEMALDQIRTMERLIKHEGFLAEVRQDLIRLGRSFRYSLNRILGRLPVVDASEESVRLRELQRESCVYVIKKLEGLMGDADTQTEDVATVLLDYQRMARAATDKLPTLSKLAKASDKADEIEALALRLELKYIQQMVDEDRMTRSYARRMRENVALMQIDLEGTV